MRKYTADGELLWEKNIFNLYTDGYPQFLNDIVVDKEGAIYLGGSTEFEHKYYINGESIVINEKGKENAFVLKLDSKGNTIWVKGFGENAAVTSLVLSPDDHLYVMGDFRNDLSIKMYTSLIKSLSTTKNDIFYQKWTLKGEVLNISQRGTGNYVEAAIRDVTVDKENNIYAVGDLGGNLFIEKISNDLGKVWSKEIIGKHQYNMMKGIVLDADQNVYVAGTINKDTVDINFDKEEFIVNANTSFNSFLQKLDNQGTFLWAKQTPQTHSISLEIGSNNNLFVIGGISSEFDKEIDIDPGENTFLLPHNGKFLTKYSTSCDQVYNYPPIITKPIQTQLKEPHFSAYSIDLDSIFEDKETVDSLLKYSFSSSDNIKISIEKNIAKIDSSIGWIGEEKLVFSAEDLAGNVTSDTVLFIVDIPAPELGLCWGVYQGGEDSYSSISLRIESEGIAITADQNHNTYTIGSFYRSFMTENDTISYNGEGRYIQKRLENGQIAWTKPILFDRYLNVNDVVVGHDNHLYLVGEFYAKLQIPIKGDTVVFERENWTSFVAKMDTTGEFIWFKPALTNISKAVSLVTDKHDYVYVIGNCEGNPKFDEKDTDNTRTDREAIFIEKLDIEGDFIWVRTFKNESLEREPAIAVDENQHVYITSFYNDGFFNDPVNLDTRPNPSDEYKVYARDAFKQTFIVGLDQDGYTKWAKAYYGNKNAGWDIKVHKGNVYVVGEFSGAIDLNRNFAKYEASYNYLTAVNEKDVYVVKYNADNGSFIWKQQFEGLSTETETETGTEIEISSSNYIFVRTNEMSVTKLDTAGNILQKGTSWGQKNMTTNDMMMDQNGNLYFTGYLVKSQDFDPSEDELILQSYGSHIVGSFVSCLSLNCSRQQTNQILDVISDIEDQQLNKNFETYTIDLTQYFNDIYEGGNLNFSTVGEENLNIIIEDGIATVSIKNADFIGVEQITFIATNSNGVTIKQDVIFVVKKTANIEEVILGQKIVYPNPVTAHFYVNHEYDQVQISNVKGQFIRSYKQGEQLSLEGLSQGMYLIKVISKTGILQMMIIKN